ncbi:MAG: protease inhibitor I42 family protein [Deltaproteobacteria bacterium]|nr:protease inhibitor I42 family protein [Deltaproteobacteria bacterium]
MKGTFVVYVVGVITVFAVVGCVIANETQKSLTYESVQCTDPARPVTVSPGKKFVIVIESNRTTGFSWEIAKPFNENVVTLMGKEYLPEKSDLDGAGGKEVWTFIAVAAGQTTIYLKYVRPWEKGIPPKQATAYTVIVR